MHTGGCGYETVDLPHTNKMLPLNYFSETEYQFVSCYKKLLEIPEGVAGKSIFLEFEGVMLACDVYCNGILAGRHEGGYTPFTVELPGQCALGRKTYLSSAWIPGSWEASLLWECGGLSDLRRHFTGGMAVRRRAGAAGASVA